MLAATIVLASACGRLEYDPLEPSCDACAPRDSASTPDGAPSRDAAVAEADAADAEPWPVDAPPADAPPPTGPAGLLAHYALDERSGDLALDVLGRHDARFSSEPRWGAGIVGGAVELTGATELVIPAAVASQMQSAFTVALWLKRDVTPERWDRTLVLGSYQERNPWDEASQWVRVWQGPNEFTCGASRYVGLGCLAGLRNGTWRHVAVTFDGARSELWVDGSLVSAPTTSAPTLSGTPALSVGVDWIGWIDEVQLFDRALDASEVAVLATQ